MNKRILYAIVPLLIASLWGCRTTKTATATHGNEAITALETLATCEVENISVDVLVRTRHDSIVWATARKMVELGRAQFTPDSVAVNLSIYNKRYKGTYTDLYNLTGYRTSFEEIQRLVENAYSQQATNAVLPIDAPKLNISTTLHATIKRQTNSSSPLSYPFK